MVAVTGQPSFWVWPFEQNNELGGQPVPNAPSDFSSSAEAWMGTWGKEIEARADFVNRIGLVAADCLARAVARGVYEATALGAFPAYREVHRRR